MKEKEKVKSLLVPCMFNHRKLCVDCTLYSPNVESLRWYMKNAEFKSEFSRCIGEFPTIEQVAMLLFNYEKSYPVIKTKEFGWTYIPKNLAAIAKAIDESRKNYVIKRFSVFNIEDYAFYVRCPNFKRFSK